MSIKTTCPTCGMPGSVPVGHESRMIRCPRCKDEFCPVPGPSPPIPAAPPKAKPTLNADPRSRNGEFERVGLRVLLYLVFLASLPASFLGYQIAPICFVIALAGLACSARRII